MSWILSNLLIGIGVYLLIGIGVYKYIHRLLNVKHAKDFGQDDKDQFELTFSMVIVMVMWPKLVFPWVWGAWKAVQEERRRRR